MRIFPFGPDTVRNTEKKQADYKGDKTSHNCTADPPQLVFFAARFLSFARLMLASFLSRAALGTVNTMRRALLMRSASVEPGTDGTGSGFMSYPSAEVCSMRERLVKPYRCDGA